MLVGTLTGDELLMGATLDNAAVLHDAYQVGVLDGAQAMGDDQCGAAMHELVEGVLHEVFALGVKGAGGLVEDEDGRIL